MRRSMLRTAMPAIADWFSLQTQQVYRAQDIGGVLRANQASGLLPGSLATSRFISALLSEGVLQAVEIHFPSRRDIRYVHGRPSVYPLALSLKPDGYFSHFTAMAVHNLTDQIPKTIYLNSEQAGRSTPRIIPQHRIDAAFARKPRVSANRASLWDCTIVLLNGMQTGRLGVINATSQEGDPIPVTGLERTLLDITVRPFYSGGVFEVLEAFRRAREAVDVTRLSNMLKQLAYAYPYNQAVGFYMDRAGVYTREELGILRGFGLNCDFYLTHGMHEPQYSAEWRLYFPKGF